MCVYVCVQALYLSCPGSLLCQPSLQVIVIWLKRRESLWEDHSSPDSKRQKEKLRGRWRSNPSQSCYPEPAFPLLTKARLTIVWTVSARQDQFRAREDPRTI